MNKHSSFKFQEFQASQAVQVSTDEDSGTFTCHICDTEIPKTHMRFHLEGDKHQTCLQIADVALERSRKQLSLEVQPLYDEDPRTYYCDPCSVILLKSDKETHETSEPHIENVQYYNVLRTFSAFYMTREDVYSLKESDAIFTLSSQSTPTEQKPTESKIECLDTSKEAELQEVLNHLKEATAHIQSSGGSKAALDPNLNKALNSLKLTVDHTLHEIQETVARKESVFDKAITHLKESAEKTLHDLKESAEIKHQTDIERKRLSHEAEMEISKFKRKLSKLNVVRKNTKKTNLPQLLDCECKDDPQKSKKIGPSFQEWVKAKFVSPPKPNKSSPPY